MPLLVFPRGSDPVTHWISDGAGLKTGLYNGGEVLSPLLEIVPQ